MSERIRILLVDDHSILREGLRALLEIEADLCVLAEASSVAQALQDVVALQPDLVLTDLALPDCSGLELVRQLRAAGDLPRVLVLTAHNGEEYIRAALDARAHGYVLKDSSRAELLHAIRTVHAGQQYLCQAVATQVISGFLGNDRPRALPHTVQVVTQREREVLVRIALGEPNKVVARELNVSIKTVEKHRANLMRKLALHNTAAITRYAIRHRLIGADFDSGNVPVVAASRSHGGNS